MLAQLALKVGTGSTGVYTANTGALDRLGEEFWKMSGTRDEEDGAGTEESGSIRGASL